MADPSTPKPLRVKLAILLILAIAFAGVAGKPWIVRATGIDGMSTESRLEWAAALAVIAAGLVFYVRAKAKDKPHA